MIASFDVQVLVFFNNCSTQNLIFLAVSRQLNRWPWHSLTPSLLTHFWKTLPSRLVTLETCNQSYEETLAVQRKDFLFRAKCEKIEKLYWESFHHYQGKHQSPSSMNVEVTISESISDEGAWIYHNVLGRSYLTNIIPDIYHRQYMYRTEHLCAQTLNTLKITQNINHMPYMPHRSIFSELSGICGRQYGEADKSNNEKGSRSPK